MVSQEEFLAFNRSVERMVSKPNHTVGYQGIFVPILTAFLLPYPYEPPYAPKVLPPVGAMDHPLPGCFKNPFVARCVGRLLG